MKFFLMALFCVVLLSCSKSNSPVESTINTPSFSAYINGRYWVADSCWCVAYNTGTDSMYYHFAAIGDTSLQFWLRKSEMYYVVQGESSFLDSRDVNAFDTGTFWLLGIMRGFAWNGNKLESQIPTCTVRITECDNIIAGTINGILISQEPPTKGDSITISNGNFSFQR